MRYVLPLLVVAAIAVAALAPTANAAPAKGRWHYALGSGACAGAGGCTSYRMECRTAKGKLLLPARTVSPKRAKQMAGDRCG